MTTIDEYITAVEVLQEEGRNEEALVLLETAMAQFPESSRLWEEKGYTLRLLSQWGDSLAAYELVIHLDADSAKAWRGKSLALFQLHRHKEALTSVEKAIGLDDKTAWAWHLQGVIVSNLGNWEAALDACEQAIALEHQMATAWDSKGTALYSLGRHKGALNAYEQAIALNPQLAGSLHGKGNALCSLGRHEVALDAYEQAIAIDPKLADAWNGKGNALKDLGRYEAALDAYEQAIAINPHLAGAWNGKGNALNDLGRNEVALDAYEQAIAIDRKLAHAWNGKGNALDDLGRYEAALGAYDQVIAHDPKLAHAWLGKYRLFTGLGFEPRAICYALRFFVMGGFAQYASKVGDFLTFLSTYPAPYFTRKFLLDHGLHELRPWRQLLTDTQQECECMDRIITQIQENRPDEDLPASDHTLIALLTLYMGDPITAYDRLDSLALDAAPDDVRAQYYLLVAAEGFCEPFAGELEDFCQQAEDLAADYASADPRDCYYSGLIQLIAAERPHRIPIEQVLGAWVEKPKEYDPALLEKALRHFQAAGDFLPARYMTAMTLQLLGRTTELQRVVHTILEEELRLQGSGQGFLLEQVLELMSGMPGEVRAKVDHFAHSREIWEAVQLVYAHAVDPVSGKPREKHWAFAEKFDGTQQAPYAVWHLSAQAEDDFAQADAQRVAAAAAALERRLRHELDDFPWYSTATDAKAIESKLITEIQAQTSLPLLGDLIRYLLAHGRLTPFQAWTIRLYLELAKRKGIGPLTRKVAEVFVGVSITIGTYTALPDADGQARDVLKVLASGGSGLLAWAAVNFLVERYGQAELPTFASFKADFLAHAVALRTEMGDAWEGSVFDLGME